MRLSILPKWLMLFATIVLSCTLRAGGEGTASPFRTHVNSFPTVSADTISNEVFRFPENSIGCSFGLSPNGMFLTTCYSLQDVKPISDRVVIDIGTRRELARFRRIEGNGTVLLPINERWSPDSSELYLGYWFEDLQNGPFWFQWDLKKGQFTKEAEEELTKLRSMRALERPDWMTSHKAYNCGPIWTFHGQKYDNVSVIHFRAVIGLDEDGNPDWRHPDFRGSPRYWLSLKEKVVHEVFVEARHTVQPGERLTYRAHVFHEGRLIETYMSPSDLIPGRLLMEYRDRELWLYMDLPQNLAWKANLGRTRVDYVFDLKGVKGRQNGEALLMVTENGQTSVRLIRERALLLK